MSQERTEQVFEESSDRGKEGQIEIGVTRDTWTCNDCGFEMNADHYNADSPEGCREYDCPVCENEELESEIDRLNAVITGQAEAIREQTAKVQERDEEIKKQDFLIDNLRKQRDETETVVMQQIQFRDKEIERLRAEMKTVANMLEQFHTLTYGFAIEMADIQAARLRAALKGAE